MGDINEGLSREIQSGIGSLREALAAQLATGLDTIRAKVGAIEQSLETRSSTEDLAQIRTIVTGLQTRVEEIVSRPRLPGAGSGQNPIRQLAERLHASEHFRGAIRSRAGLPSPGQGFRLEGDGLPSVLRAFCSSPQRHRLSATELGDFSLPAYRGAPVLGRDGITGFVARSPYEMMPGARDYRVTKETAPSKLGGVSTTLNGAVTGGAGATATFDNVEGVTPGAVFRFFGDVNEDCTVLSVNTTTKVVTFTEDIEEDFDDEARVCSLVFGGIAEEALKPSGYFAGDEETYSFLLLPTLIAITEQQIQTVEGIESLLRGRMNRRLSYNLEWHGIQGDSDNTDQLAGILSDDDATTTTWSDCPAGSNRIDCMLIAANEVEMRGYVDVTLELNPLDRLYALISKGTDSHYVMTSFGPVAIGNGYIDRFPVGLSSLMPAGSGSAIDHMAAHVFGDRQLDAWAVGWMNDDFGKNILRLRAEIDVLHAILSTDAYELIDFDAAP